MNNNNHYTVDGWMVNELNLRGNELICYAIIYGFSQDGESMFYGSLSYLQSWMNATKPTVLLCLQKLVEKGLIHKCEKVVDKVRYCYYQTTKEPLQGGSKDSLVGGIKEPLQGGSKDSLPNNKYKVIKDNNKEKRLSNDNQKMQDELFEKFWESYGYKKGKQPCQKAWKRLTKQDKESAIAAIGKYKEDCRENQRQMKHPTTYLNQRTWEDDFTNNGMQEDDRWQQQREWLQEHCPNIADKITSRMLTMFREMCLCDSQMTAETLEQLNEVYEGGDIVEEFKRLRS